MIPLIIVSTLVTQHMEKGDYVPLWYFTNTGLDDAMKAFNILKDEALSFIKRSDGSTLLVPALSSKESRNVIVDSELSWDEFCIATPHMILVMSRAEWPPNCITMMMEFWSNLNMHPYRSSRDQLDQDALLLYQAEQRKLWHQAINSPGHGYDLSQINEELLHQTKDRLYWLEWERKDRGRDLHVSNLLINSNFPTTDDCMISPPSSPFSFGPQFSFHLPPLRTPALLVVSRAGMQCFFQVYLICTIMSWLCDGTSICTPIDHATLDIGCIKFHEISLEFR